MDDVGNQTSCRLAGLRPGTVYFVQVRLVWRLLKWVWLWFHPVNNVVFCFLFFYVGPLQPGGYLRLSQSRDLERVEPSHCCVHAPQRWAPTRNTRTKSAFWFRSQLLNNITSREFRSEFLQIRIKKPHFGSFSAGQSRTGPIRVIFRTKRWELQIKNRTARVLMWLSQEFYQSRTTFSHWKRSNEWPNSFLFPSLALARS